MVSTVDRHETNKPVEFAGSQIPGQLTARTISHQERNLDADVVEYSGDGFGVKMWVVADHRGAQPRGVQPLAYRAITEREMPGSGQHDDGGSLVRPRNVDLHSTAVNRDDLVQFTVTRRWRPWARGAKLGRRTHR